MTPHGICDIRYESVREAFGMSFGGYAQAVDNEHGAAICVMHRGKVIVDLWAGFRDSKSLLPWTADTLAPVMSVTKSFSALCIHHLQERGQLDIDLPVSTYWPAFGNVGKEGVLIKHVLEHRAGVPVVAEAVRNLGFSRQAWSAALEAAPLVSTPGTVATYHAVTFGYILGELVYRISGISIGEYWKKHFSNEIGCQAFIGVSEDQIDQVADWCPLSEHDVNAAIDQAPNLPAFLPITQLMRPVDFNSAELRKAEIPAANGFASARGLAELYAALGDCWQGQPSSALQLSMATMRRATSERWEAPEKSSSLNWRVALGFMLSTDFAYMGPDKRSFGHPGSGGASGFYDPESDIAVGYVLNRPYPGGGSGKRFLKLMDALYSSHQKFQA